MAYFRTNHFDEAVSAIEAVADFSASVVADPYRWKWVVVAVHGTVQAFMILALHRGNGLLAMPDKRRDEWLKKYRAGEPLPAALPPSPIICKNIAFLYSFAYDWEWLRLTNI